MFTSLVVAALTASSAHAASYVGCNDLFDLGIATPTFPKATEQQCIATCNDRGNPWAFYDLSSKWCFCAVDSSASRAYTSPGNKDQCTNFRVWALQTTFDDVKCSDKMTLDPRDKNAPSSTPLYLNMCYRNCKKYKYAIFQPRGAGFLGVNYKCQCANYPPVTSGGTVCGRNNYYIQEHTPGEAASGLARRELKERAVRAQAALDANPYCPTGLSPCQISPDAADGYECLRTESELESCGGCVYGTYGQVNSTGTGTDCTTLAGVDAAGVTCKLGACQVSRCRRGFRLSSGVCEARS